MKRGLLFSSLATASAMVYAQSGITLYGIVDAGVTSVSGLRGGSMTQLVSGIMDGSRLGIRGSEDLGGGYRAIMTLQHRFEADTGLISSRPASGSQLPDRLSQAALSTRAQFWSPTQSSAGETTVLVSSGWATPTGSATTKPRTRLRL